MDNDNAGVIDVPAAVNYRDGIYVIDFLGHISLIGNASDLSSNEHPVYLSLMMDRKQIQAILDNQHLFDIGMVNAARLIALSYDAAEISYTA